MSKADFNIWQLAVLFSAIGNIIAMIRHIYNDSYGWLVVDAVLLTFLACVWWRVRKMYVNNKI